MGILSNLSGKEAAKIFQKFGYMLHHQIGSHMILYHDQNQPYQFRIIKN